MHAGTGLGVADHNCGSAELVLKQKLIIRLVEPSGQAGQFYADECGHSGHLRIERPA